MDTPGIYSQPAVCLSMKTVLEFWLPKYSVALPETLEVQDLLSKLKRRYDVRIEVLKNEVEEGALKGQMLTPSVWHRIRFPQTRKGKSLYPVLVVRHGGELVSFFPQRRGREQVTMTEFLKGLLRGEVKSLHPLTM